MTVLVVDDESAVRRVVHRALERDGVSVVEADSGEAALAVIQVRAAAAETRLQGAVVHSRSVDLLNMARLITVNKPSPGWPTP